MKDLLIGMFAAATLLAVASDEFIDEQPLCEAALSSWQSPAEAQRAVFDEGHQAHGLNGPRVTCESR